MPPLAADAIPEDPPARCTGGTRNCGDSPSFEPVGATGRLPRRVPRQSAARSRISCAPPPCHQRGTSASDTRHVPDEKGGGDPGHDGHNGQLGQGGGSRVRLGHSGHTGHLEAQTRSTRHTSFTAGSSQGMGIHLTPPLCRRRHQCERGRLLVHGGSTAAPTLALRYQRAEWCPLSAHSRKAAERGVGSRQWAHVVQAGSASARGAPACGAGPRAQGTPAPAAGRAEGPPPRCQASSAAAVEEAFPDLGGSNRSDSPSSKGGCQRPYELEQIRPRPHRSEHAQESRTSTWNMMYSLSPSIYLSKNIYIYIYIYMCIYINI